MKCTNCGAELGTTDRFCTTCGMQVPEANLRRGCTKCGAELRDADRFCPKCGHPAPAVLTTPTASAAPDPSALGPLAFSGAGKREEEDRHSQDVVEPLRHKPRRNGDKAWIWALLAAAVMALLGIAALVGAVTNPSFRDSLIDSLGLSTPTPESTAMLSGTATEPLAEPSLQATATPTAPDLSALQTATAEYVDALGVEFVDDVTIPDDTIVHAGERFIKTWRVLNGGKAPWPTGARLIYVTGDLLGGAASAPLVEPVAPGDSVDISVPMSAPTISGSYRGSWQMQAPDGHTFGSTLAVVVRVVSVTPTPRATRTPALAPVIFDLRWDASWASIENRGYWAEDADGIKYVAELAFLNTPAATAAIKETVPKGWKARLIMRDQVGWVSCTTSICQEHTVDNPQQLITNQVYFRSEVWTSLLTDYQTGGWQAMIKNADYQKIQKAVFEPIGTVPETPCLTFRFTPVD
ncbi:MAG: NBR1-Ig-like domain-containing protein [Anaerolineae bacterium]